MIPKDNKGEKKPTLRRSQTITTFGVGAIADLPDASVMVCGIDRWDTKGSVKLNDPRLEEKLGVKYFLMPPDTERSTDGIKAVRFPRWFRCRGKCKRLNHIETWRERGQKVSSYKPFDELPFCDLCSQLPLIPSRFVIACRKGHIDDFPFLEWAHTGGGVCSKPQLQYIEVGNQGALSGILIKCSTCGKARNMGGSFGRETMAAFASCKGAMPWQIKWESECGEAVVTLQRGGTNVHFPQIKSSILIPPHTTEGLKTKIINSMPWALYESQNGGMTKEQLMTFLLNDLRVDPKEIEPIVNDLLGEKEDQPESVKSEEDYRYEEYKAFLGEYDKEHHFTKDFLIDEQAVEDYKQPFLKSVVLAKRLREIRVQTGFSRIKPPQKHDETGREINEDERVEAMPVAENRRIRWLPGYEVRGEGIFLDLDQELLAKWVKREGVQGRLGKLLRRSSKNPDSFGVMEKLTPEFILLHTLSHLLIRQLSFECGYSSSALRERIYCSSDQKSRPMAGILIYTADGDADGTLGGLVRQGEPDLLPDTIMRALDGARWCSTDPLCIEADGQGYQGMNLAACHSCAMLPETSCEMLNRYLDRSSLIGSINNPEIGMFSKILEDRV